MAEKGCGCLVLILFFLFFPSAAISLFIILAIVWAVLALIG